MRSFSGNGLASKDLGGTGGATVLDPLLRLVVLRFSNSIDPAAKTAQ